MASKRESERACPRTSCTHSSRTDDDDDGERKHPRRGGCFEEVARHEHGEELAVAGKERFRGAIPEVAGISVAFDPQEVGEGQEDQVADDTPGGEEEIW